MSDNILNGVQKYYSDKIKEHGVSAKGVDWNSQESQYLRFKQLSNIIIKPNFSLIDFGCGYGELINFLNLSHKNYEYIGYDISDAMLHEANRLFENSPLAKFTNTLHNLQADYIIGSGLFNVKMDFANNEQWFEFIISTLTTMNEKSIHGFSFNALTKYSDAEYMKDYLYYADPLKLFDYCKKNFSKNVALLHDYHLYEFTILVRKDG